MPASLRLLQCLAAAALSTLCRCNIQSEQPNPDTAPTLPAPPNSTSTSPPFYTEPVVNSAPPNGVGVPGTSTSIPYFWIIAVLIAIAIVALCIWRRRRRRRALARRSHRKRRRSECRQVDQQASPLDDEDASSEESVHSRYTAAEPHMAAAARHGAPKRARLHGWMAGTSRGKRGHKVVEAAVTGAEYAATIKAHGPRGTARQLVREAAEVPRSHASRHRLHTQHQRHSHHHSRSKSAELGAGSRSKHRHRLQSKANSNASSSWQVQSSQYSFHGV